MAKIVPIEPAGPAGDRVGIERAEAAGDCEYEMEAHGLSAARAAREIGISGARLSRWLAGTYDGDVTVTTAAVRAWLRSRREAEALSVAPAGLDRHAGLEVTGGIHAVLSHAQASGDVVLIHGRSGAGKTWALRRYAEGRSGFHLCTMTVAVGTLVGMLYRVADACGAGPDHRSALAAERAAIDRLRDRGALLAIDEANHLSAPLLDELRCVSDGAGCGLALVGGDEIAATLARCGQITGRIGIRMPLRPASDRDAAAVAESVLGRRPDKGEMKSIRAAARGPGGLHALRRLLMRAWMLARAEGRVEIAAGDIAAASQDKASC